MRTALLAALAAVAVAATVAQGVVVRSLDSDCVIDPVPYERLLAEVIERINEGNWDGARELLAVAGEAQICSPELLSRHRDLYEHMSQLVDLLERASALEDRFGAGDTAGLREDVREVYNGLDYLRQVVYDRVIDYYRFLGRYAENKASFFEYGLMISRGLDTLKGVVGFAMERLARIYVMLGKEGPGAWLSISVSLPRRIYAGDEIAVAVLAELNSSSGSVADVGDVRVRVSLVIGYALEVSEEVVTGVGANTTVYLRVPDTAEMIREGVGFIKLVGGVYAALAKVTVTAESLVGNVSGLTVRSTYVYAVHPPIEYHVPPYAEVNGTLSVKVASHATIPLNVSVYVDEVGNETFLTNATVEPGYSWVNISLENVSVGYHRIVFVTHPAGRYVSVTKSSAVVIGSPTVPVTLDVPVVVLVPPYVISVGGEVSAPVGGCDVIVYVGGEEAFRTSLSGPGFRAVLGLPIGPSTLFIGSVRVRVEVVPHDPRLGPSEYVVDVVVINVVSALVVVGVTSVLYAHPRTYAVLSSLVRAVLVRGGGRGSRSFVAVAMGRSFRRFRLRRFYAALVRLLSRFAEPPAPHETLREYASRAVARLPGRVAGLVRRLILLFELDLYSRRSPDPGEAEELVRAVEEGLGEGVGEG